jgi:hypothetical protein
MVIHIKTKRVGASLGTGERRVAKRKRTDLNSLSPPPKHRTTLCTHLWKCIAGHRYWLTIKSNRGNKKKRRPRRGWQSNTSSNLPRRKFPSLIYSRTRKEWNSWTGDPRRSSSSSSRWGRSLKSLYSFSIWREGPAMSKFLFLFFFCYVRRNHNNDLKWLFWFRRLLLDR